MKMFLSDLHSHMLPGVDDGAKSVLQTSSMVKMAYDEGVRRIFFTPHYGIYNENCCADTLRSVFQEMKEAFLSQFEDLELYLGNEIFYGPETVSMLQAGKALRMADTDYVLIEFHPAEEYSRMEKAVQSLVLAGYRPVIAHAERYQCLRKHPADTEELIYRGAKIQINSGSLLRGSLDGGFRLVRKLLKDDLVHFIGSDCHNDSERRPQMKAPAEKLRQMVGNAQAERILWENGERLLRNQPIEI
ncbi:MAG: CpsB/CapC family capsule biosynthesis tyrosine phosphatase [Anaerovoracaceae bacterium]